MHSECERVFFNRHHVHISISEFDDMLYERNAFVLIKALKHEHLLAVAKIIY